MKIEFYEKQKEFHLKITRSLFFQVFFSVGM